MVKVLVLVALWTVNIATCADGSPTHDGHRGLPGDLHGRTPPRWKCCVWRGSFPTCSLRLRGGEDDNGADEGVQIFRTVHGYDLEPVPSFSLRTPDQDHGVVCGQHTGGQINRACGKCRALSLHTCKSTHMYLVCCVCMYVLHVTYMPRGFYQQDGAIPTWILSAGRCEYQNMKTSHFCRIMEHMD